MKKILIIKSLLLIIYAIAVLTISRSPYLLCVILIIPIMFQYIIEKYLIEKCVNHLTSAAIKLIIINLLHINILPITFFIWLLRGDSLTSKQILPLVPFIIINLAFAIIIFIQLKKNDLQGSASSKTISNQTELENKCHMSTP